MNTNQSHQSVGEQIDYYSRQLRIPAFRKSFQTKAQQAAQDNLSFEQYLLNLMQLEYEQRMIRRKKQRIRRADLPYHKYLQDLIVDQFPPDAQTKLKNHPKTRFYR